jgi:hypothetical protein
MNARQKFGSMLISALFLTGVQTARAGVVVSASGDTAIANISLTSGGHTYTADITITFTGAQNLNPTELNLSAQLVDATDPGLLARLPPCLVPSSGCVTIDPSFPMLVTVEPLSLATGNLTFLNDYSIEVHTANLSYVPYSHYRLDKAPVTGAFSDITTSVESGSVRSNGRGGTFSQFLVVSDTRSSLTVEQQKNAKLLARILSSTLNNALHNQLLGLLASVTTAVNLGDYTLAIANVDQLINTVQANAGTNIANEWSSNHLLLNDAGDMLSLAQTLRFTLVRLQSGH